MTTLATLLINLPTFTPSTEVAEIIAFLDEHEYSHLALVDTDHKWIGNLPSALLYEVDETETLAAISYLVEPFFVFLTDGLAKIADTFIQNKCDILPVLDETMQLKGMLPKSALTNYLLESTFLTEVGTTLIIETETAACSFSNIAQIVESNNNKLLGILVLSTLENKTQLLLRLTQKNIETIIYDLRRFDFTIISQHDEDLHQNKLIEHSNYLNKFLNI